MKNNVVLDENSVEWKSYINRESMILELTIKLYSCHDINMKFLVFVTPPSIYQVYCSWIVKKGVVDVLYSFSVLRV